MFASTSKIQRNAVNLSGFIMNSAGERVHISDGVSSIGISGKPDILELGTLLSIAGINLDSPSPVNSSNSIRYDGINIFVFIEYSNTFSYSLDNLRYTYQAIDI
eukprot:gene2266-2568_t